MPEPNADADECERCGEWSRECAEIEVYDNLTGWYTIWACPDCHCRLRGDD